MKVLIRKDSSDIRNRLERLGYTASDKSLDGFGDGIFVDKSDNTFHVKSLIKVDNFPIINTSSIKDVLYFEYKEYNVIEVTIVSVYGV